MQCLQLSLRCELSSGWASSGYVKSIVTPAPLNVAVGSDEAPTVHINPESKSSKTIKKQTFFLAGIKLQMKTTPKEYLSLTNHDSTLPAKTARVTFRFSGKAEAYLTVLYVEYDC